MNNIERNSLLIIALVIIDQTFKSLIAYFKPTIELFILTLHFVKNTGASFGILQNQNLLLIFVSLIAIGVIMLNVRSIRREFQLPMVLISSGVIGNLIDRIFRGYVVDFINFHFFPVFNVADSLITIGVVWIVALVFLESKNVKNAKTKKVKSKN